MSKFIFGFITGLFLISALPAIFYLLILGSIFILIEFLFDKYD